MPKFSKVVRDEIRFKYALRDDSGMRVYTQKTLAKDESLAIKREFDSYSDYRIHQYLVKGVKRGFKFSDLESRVD